MKKIVFLLIAFSLLLTVTIVSHFHQNAENEIMLKNLELVCYADDEGGISNTTGPGQIEDCPFPHPGSFKICLGYNEYFCEEYNDCLLE